MSPNSTSDAREVARALAARNVVLRYGDVVALDGASIEVTAGTTLALVGESGSGKTTLLRCFNRMVEPDSGHVLVGGEDVRSESVTVLRRHIGYVPQNGGLLPHWRVLRNVALVPNLLGLEDADILARHALDVVGMPATTFGHRFPHELSGGQRQRVALARALAARPGVILLDEPFGALDAITRSDLHDAFENARRAFSVTMLLVTHDLAEAARLADEIAVMRAGRVEQRGILNDLYTSPSTEYVAALLDRALATSAHLKPR
ncbi:MAG: ATP-binding cassette domain-containing protein [Gemmatimonadaceae bacterium]